MIMCTRPTVTRNIITTIMTMIMGTTMESPMLEGFVIRAILAGCGVALIAGPLGCVIVWRRMAYFGDTLSHAALMGVALGVLLGVAPMIGVAVTGIVVSLCLFALQSQ